MTHAEFARELMHAYIEWPTDAVGCGGGHYTPYGWCAEMRGGYVYVWGPGEDWQHPPFKANAKAIHREVVAAAKRGAKQLSLF